MKVRNKQIKLIKAILSNDEISTDHELIEYFINNKVNKALAISYINDRNYYLHGGVK